jgi:hypothetical protein
MNQEVREFVKQSGVNVHGAADEAARRERMRRSEEIVRNRLSAPSCPQPPPPRPVINEFRAPVLPAPVPRCVPTPVRRCVPRVTYQPRYRRKHVIVKCTPNQLLNASRLTRGKCACIRRASMMYVAKNLGIKRTSNATKHQIYNMINRKTAPVRKRIKKRKLDDESIRKRLKRMYGSRFIKKYKPNLNADVQRVKWGMKSLKKDRLGLPFKYTVLKLERRLVKKWKKQKRMR